MIRKLALSLALCAFVCAGPVTDAMAAGKIGVAHLVAVTAQSQAGQAAEKQLESMFGKERKQLESQAQALSKKIEELNKQAAALSEKARAERGADIQKQIREHEAKSAAFGQRVAAAQQAINTQLQDIVGTACANFAKKNGYEVLINGAAVMYATDDTNVTKGLIEEINKVWKSKGSKFNIPAAKK